MKNQEIMGLFLVVLAAIFIGVILSQIIHFICYAFWSWLEIRKRKRRISEKQIHGLNINWNSNESIVFISNLPTNQEV